ncbi:hypothetical protein OROGR_022609 [Orobanche gracilis]
MEELKSLKGIGEKRATYILELREESPEPFKSESNPVLLDLGKNSWQLRYHQARELDGTRVVMNSYPVFSVGHGVDSWEEKKLDDLEDIGLSAKQIKGMMKQAAGDLFS